MAGLQNVNGTLYFIADDGVSGYEIWKSNGTSSGTVLVDDISGDSGNSAPKTMLLVGTKLYVVAFTNANGLELFSLDLSAL
jgi:ELWxxDGT repeat protein